jgi:hypothetical protein
VPGDTTTVIIRAQDITVLNVTSKDVTIMQTGTSSSLNNESTILYAAPATLNVPSSIQLSNSIPLTMEEIGSAGISNLAARADHVHPTVGMVLNGGNF